MLVQKLNNYINSNNNSRRMKLLMAKLRLFC